MCTEIHLEEPNSFSPLFVRRKDIDETTRIKIGIFVNYFPKHGLVTKLADQYQVCRPFIYQQKERVKSALSVLTKQGNDPIHLDLESNIKALLSFRIRGGMSISKCSDFLLDQGYTNTSEGWISETIKSLGDLVGNVLPNWSGTVVFASDEIYLVNNVAVLVSVDPISSAIISMTVCSDLNSEQWKNHWSKLAANNIYPLSIVGDEGTALKAAHSSCQSVSYQPDTFHAITQRFGKVVTQLERKALGCIKKEYERERVYTNAKSDLNRAKQAITYQQSQQATQKALTLLSDFKWLYGIINRQLKIVRSDGSIRTKQWAEGEVKAALSLMEQSLDIDLQKTVKAVRNLLPQLFLYLEKAQEVYHFLQKQVPAETLPFHLAYWQYQRELTNLKKAKSKKRLTKSKNWLIQIMKEYQQEHHQLFETEKQLVFAGMQTIIQSSSMVECINSILRPIFNESKGQVSQQTLNLVMHWHNNRVYKRGKRSGKAPIELLTANKPKKDWQQEIIDLAKKEGVLKKAG